MTDTNNVGLDYSHTNVAVNDLQAASMTVTGVSTFSSVVNTGVEQAAAFEGVAGPPSVGYATFAFATDANAVLPAASYIKGILKVTSAVISTTRNLQVPLVAGAELTFMNGEGHSVQIIGPTGTGITVATTKTAVLWCDGTNWLRVTADT